MKKSIFGVAALVGLATIGLASCNKADPDEFGVNTDAKSEIEMYIIGSRWNSWSESTIKEADPSCAFVVDAASAGLDSAYTYEVEITDDSLFNVKEDGTKEAVWTGFKFIASNSWASQFGVEDLDFEASKEFFEYMYGDKNGDEVVDINDKYEFKKGTSDRSNIEITKPCKLKISYYPFHFDSENVKDVLYTSKFAITMVK